MGMPACDRDEGLGLRLERPSRLLDRHDQAFDRRGPLPREVLQASDPSRAQLEPLHPSAVQLSEGSISATAGLATPFAAETYSLSRPMVMFTRAAFAASEDLEALRCGRLLIS